MTQSYGQTILLSESAFKFYGDAVIDRETLKKDTALLNLKVHQKDTALENRNDKIEELTFINKTEKVKADNYMSDLGICGKKIEKKDKWNKVFVKGFLTALSVAVLEGVICYELIKNK